MGGNKLIIGVSILFIVVILGFSFFYFAGGQDSGGTLQVSGPNATDTAATIANRDFLIVLGKFQRISLTTSVLEDRVFQSLVDQSVTLPESPFGRPNPFAPLGVNVSATSTSSAGSR